MIPRQGGIAVGVVCMSEDIKPILDRWPISEGQNVRKIIGADGVERIQIRVCIDTYHGLLQFDADGRPDGQRPHGCGFALDYHEQLLARSRRDGTVFSLDEQDCAELIAESHMVYQRYVLLLQVGDYPRVIRDTDRNMRMFRFVHEHAARGEDRVQLDKWWPYVIRIQQTAKILQAMAREDYDTAAAELATARRWIGELEEMEDETFQVERKRSLDALADLERQFRQQRPPTEIEQLERDKDKAIRNEDYRRAAELRDRITAIKRSARKPHHGQ
jgi:hypothetical protein